MGQRIKTKTSRGRKLAFPLETAAEALTAAGVAGLLAVIIAILPELMPDGSREDRPTPRIARYIHSGRFVADVRTAAGMLQYVFETDTPAVTNVIEPGQTSTNLVTSGRARIIKPKA